MHGPPGAGKTTVALITLPGAHVVSTEMDEAGIRRYEERLGLPITSASTPRLIQPTDEEGKPDGPPYVDLGLPDDRFTPELVVDSATEFERPMDLVRTVAEYCEHTGARAIVITHETVEGTARGGHSIPHYVWQHVRVHYDHLGRRQITVLKNRSGIAPLSVGFHIDAESQSALQDQFFSVEGSGPGQLYLAPYPHAKGATRTDVLRLAMETGLDLPPPPIAVAAKRLELAPSGWSEPPDWRARKAYAESNGVNYFSPIYKD